MTCELCSQLGRYNVPADVRATIPMAGEWPSYWLCYDCAVDIEAYVELAPDLLAHYDQTKEKDA